jgi:hypothetical protein
MAAMDVIVAGMMYVSRVAVGDVTSVSTVSGVSRVAVPVPGLPMMPETAERHGAEAKDT